MRIRRRIRRFIRAFRVSRSVRLFIWVPLLIVLTAVLIWGTPAFYVTSVTVEGAQVLPEVEIELAAREALQAPLLGPWFPGNIAIFPATRITNALSAALPRIDTVQVSRTLRDRVMHITLVERQTFAIYCTAHEESTTQSATNEEEIIEPRELGTFPPLTPGVCFLMDRSGIIFADAPQTEGSLIMTLLDAEAGEVFYGSLAIDRAILEEIIVTWETFTQGINVRPRRVLKRPEGVITIETFEGWEAVLSRAHPLEDQVIALRELLAKDLTVEERAQIDVIDLRVPGRIYYH